MLLKSFFLYLILLSYTLSSAQSISKLIELDTLKTNEEKLEFLKQRIDKEVYSNPNRVVVYAQIFDSITNIVNTPEWKAESNNYQGVAFYVSQEYDKAIAFYLEAARYFEKVQNGPKLYRIYNNLAACYNVRNDFTNTEKYFLKSLEIVTTLHDKNWVANINNNLAVLYMNNKLYKKADGAIHNALSFYTQEKDSLMLGITYMNLGNSKIYQNQYRLAQTNYTQAMDLVAFEKVPLLYAVSETGIGIAQSKLGNYNKALPHLKKGVEISKSIQHIEQLMESYAALSDYYSDTKDFKNAYLLSQEAQKLKDSVLTATQDQNMAEALTKFEAEKKDAQLKVLALETEKAEEQKKIFLYLFLAGLIITALVGFFLYKNRKKNKLLAKQKTLLESTVDEKNILLRETHHRVKNSFQMVSSLLYIQSETVKNKEAQLAIKEAQNRVRSMVLIHQKLYSKDQLVGIDAKEYIEDFTKDIMDSYQFEAEKLNYSVAAESLVLDIETITPMGLILNELVTNVLKHAFKEITKESYMNIHLKEVNNELILSVIDNGKGMPKKINKASFGIELIKALTQKLKATLTIQSNKPSGTNATVIMKRYTVL